MLGWLKKLDPTARMALGLAALMLLLVIVIGTVFSVLPDKLEQTRQFRQLLSEHLATQTVETLQRQHDRLLETRFSDWLSEDWHIRSVGLRHINGHLIAAAGPHELIWQQGAKGRSIDRFSIPISTNNQNWGQLEVMFSPVEPDTLGDWLTFPPLLAGWLLFIGGGGVFYLYLRRSLEYLDPLSVIPERVRLAYDNFLEGVVIIDADARILLANEAFRHFHPAARHTLSGRQLKDLAWLTEDIEELTQTAPWMTAIQKSTPITDIRLTLRPPDAPPLRTILNCTPILDNFGAARGCMLIFSDVSALHQANEKLVEALEELAISQELIAEKNRELEKLATRDPLTGCLNRRALFDALDKLFPHVLMENDELCCIMGDIDHFKSFNDKWGHSVGDQVIIAVARTITQELRPNDLFCRYGGEEFCVFLPGLNADQALSITERLRAQIESEAGRSVRDPEGLRITSSFGVATIRHGAESAEALIDQADTALYHSKRSGRNRVSLWAANLPAGH